MNILLNFFLNVLLTGQDLFDPQWTQGNLYSISNITQKLGNFACIVISFVGFGIVIFSILKNAISGLYVVNPNFWDKVDDIKRNMIGEDGNGGGRINDMINGAVNGYNGKGNAAAKQLGGMLTYILSIVPNVKALTDFDGDEGTIDKKQYFAKSIPLLVAQIFIGMLIFFGYPSKIANWVGTAGTRVLDMVINNVDPIATVQNLSSKFIVADFTYEKSDDPYEKMVYEGASEAWTAVVSRLSDLNKKPRQEVAYKIEAWVYDAFLPHADTIGATDGFNVSVTATYTETRPNMPASFTPEAGTNLYTSVASNGTTSYRSFIDVSSLNAGQSQKIGTDDFIMVTYTCTPKALTSTSTITGVMHMGKGNPLKSSNGYIVPLKHTFNYSETSQNNCIVGTPIAVTVEVYERSSDPKSADNLVTTASANLQVSAGKFQLAFARGIDESIFNTNNSNIYWNLNFGFSTSSLKYVAIDGTTKVEIPITSFCVDNQDGIVLSNMGGADENTKPSPTTDYKKVIESLKTGNAGNTSNTSQTQ